MQLQRHAAEYNWLTCCFLREKFLQIWSAFSRKMYTLDAWEVLPVLQLRLQNKSLPMKTGRFLRCYYESFISVYKFIMTYEFVFTSCTTNGFVFSNFICFYKLKLQYIVLFCYFFRNQYQAWKPLLAFIKYYYKNQKIFAHKRNSHRTVTFQVSQNLLNIYWLNIPPTRIKGGTGFSQIKWYAAEKK